VVSLAHNGSFEKSPFSFFFLFILFPLTTFTLHNTNILLRGARNKMVFRWSQNIQQEGSLAGAVLLGCGHYDKGEA
jgi:hypothetical protein